MRKPVVDYRAFRLRKLAQPEFSHLWYLLGWVLHFVLYLFTEQLTPASACHPVHIWLDDVIPFCEWFVIPYVLWYVLLAFTTVYFMLYHPENLKRFMRYIVIVLVLASIIYVVYPTRQDLRPAVFERENICTWILGKLYGADTNTGVCPSLHVGYSIAMASVWWKERSAARWQKIFMLVCAVVIAASTCFVKQHSALDTFAALPVCLIAEVLVFGKSYWLPRLKRKKE